MFSSRKQARRSQQQAHEREQDDANTQRKVMIVDADGDWLIGEINGLGNAERVTRIPRGRSFSFLGEDERALLSRLSIHRSGLTIYMPPGGSIRRIEGYDLDTWVFRVDNGYSGRNNEYFDLAYRRIGTGDHLLYLKHYEPRQARSR